MWSPAESHISLSHFEPASELLWKHDRLHRVKMETSCAVNSANLGGTAETCVFVLLVGMRTHFFDLK